MIVVQTTLSGCRSAPGVKFANTTTSLLTGPGIKETADSIDDLKHIEVPSLNDTSSLAPDFFAPPVTFESDLPTAAWSMTLDEAISLAFRNTKALRSLNAQVLSNPSGTQTSTDAAINATDPVFGIDAALAQFDANLTATVMHANNDDVFNNSILGGGATEVVQDLTTANAAINKTNIYGTNFNFRSNITYDSNDNPLSIFPSSYRSILEATVRHPLLQGSGYQFNQIAGPNNRPGFRNTSGISIARINNKISQATFEQGVITFIDEVIGAYWNLYFAYRNFDTTRTARDGSLETWNVVKALYDNDLPGGEADKEAQAREQYFQFQQQTVVAFNGNTRGATGVLQAEANLRRLLGLPQADGKIIRPVEEPFMGDVAYDWNALLQESLHQRIEVRQQLWRIKQRELELLASKNFLQPRFDAIATVRNNGFGDRLVGGQSRFSSALTDATSGDHNEWELGVTLDMPLGFRQEYAGVKNAELRLVREKSILVEQEKQIAHDLGSSVRDNRQAFRSAQLAHNRMIAAQDAYNARKAAFEADGVTLDLLLESVRRMADAQNQFDRAQVDLQLSTELIARQSGGLLRNHTIDIFRSDPSGACTTGNCLYPGPVRKTISALQAARPVDYRF